MRRTTVISLVVAAGWLAAGTLLAQGHGGGGEGCGDVFGDLVHVQRDEVSTITPEYASETVRRFFDYGGDHAEILRSANIPPTFVIIQRINLGLYAIFASFFLLFGRDAWQVVGMLQEPVYFVSGFYFPVRSFGFAMALTASLLPLTLGLDAMRQLMFASGPTLGFLSVPLEIGLLAVLAVLFVAAARYWLAVIERKAVQEGTLTDRRR